MDREFDYKELFEKERERVAGLERELAIVRAEQKTFSRELSLEHQLAKMKKKELAEALAQANKSTRDIQKTYKKMKSVNSELERANSELKSAYYDTIHRLVLASEYKDQDTGKHISRISYFSRLLAKKKGLSDAEIEDLFIASAMHDVGKIGIPDNIILKSTRLTDREFEIIKTHTIIGAGILEDSKAKVLRVAQGIALSHHEKWDGSGYPDGLAGNKIPELARIVAITDTFDALTSKRPYKNPYPVAVACDLINQERGRHFDPAITDIFLANIEEIVRIKREIDGLENVKEASGFAWSERDLKAKKHGAVLSLITCDLGISPEAPRPWPAAKQSATP